MILDRKLNWIAGALLVVILVLLMAPSWADDHKCQGGHNCNDGDTVVNVDTPVDVDVDGAIIGGDSVRSLAVVAPGLGDVDIAQCLGSTQWSLLVGGKQKLVLNQVCMAEFYLKRGRYDLAAQALCNQPEILSEYVTEKQCEDAHDFTPAIIEGEDKYDAPPVSYYEYAEDIEQVQMQQVSFVARLDALSAQLNEPKVQPKPVVVQPPVAEYTDEQFDTVWSFLQGSKEAEDE